MIIKGKRNSAYVFADKIDSSTKTQIASILREEAYADSRIRFMSDVHSGRTAPVGTTLTLSGRVHPALVGVDIGCGMEVVFLEEREADLKKLDDFIHAHIPCGAKVHETPLFGFDLNALRCRDRVDRARALRSIGTLGGGNHFIELDRCQNGKLLLVIHSGSRQLGSDVASHYLEQARRDQCKKLKRRAGRSEEEVRCRSAEREIRNRKPVRKEEAVLEGDLFRAYLHDMGIVTAFADLNRRSMAGLICEAMGFTVRDRFSCVHNYVDVRHGILRKGAISARQGERVIVPLNMRDGAILGRGLGNPEWNFSAPHGAGRACTRTEARHAFTVEDFRREMAGIFTTTAGEGSLDECPMAYKPPERILKYLPETVEIEQIVRPVYNFKSC